MDILINGKLIIGILIPAIYVIISLSLIYFLFNLATYLISSDSAKQADAKNGIIYGIIFMFVSVSVWGLVATIDRTFLGGSTSAFPSTRSQNVNSLLDNY